MAQENVGSIEYDARINTKNIKADAKEIDGIARKTGDDIDGGVSSGTGKAEAALNKFKTIAIGAFVAIGAAAVVAGGQAIKNAINLGESINAVEKTFGEATGKILEFGKTADKQAGLSKAAFNSAVVPIGAMLRNMGYDADSAADSSIQLASRAADLASVFNTDLDSALTAIQAGLRGEADPLERFGVGLNETSVKAYALSKGIIKAGDEMTAAQKTTARLGLLFEQTNRFAGDFVDTSDQAANKSRILAARYENLSATVGQRLVPVYSKLLDAGQYLVSNFDNIVRTVQSFIPFVASLAAGFVAYEVALGVVNAKTIALTVSQVALNLAMKINPIALLVGASAALVVAYVNVLNSSDATKSATERLKVAQDNLKLSTDNVKLAEQKVTDARLAREGSDIAVQRAEERLTQLRNDGSASALDLREAEYNLSVAKDQAKAASEREKQAVEAAAKAKEDDRKNAAAVVAAQNGVRDAAYGAAGGYQLLADNIAKAKKEDAKAGNIGASGPKQTNAVFGIPARAGGGSVSANSPYFVGDNPDGSLNNTSELFVPRTSGSIVNSKTLQDALGGGGGNETTYNIGTINIADKADGERWLKKLTQNQEIIGKGMTPQQSY